MKKKKMNDKYIIHDRMFDLKWASGLVGSFIPRQWTLEEKDVVERVFGKKALLIHDELLESMLDESILSDNDKLCRMTLKFDKDTADMLEPYAIGKYKFNIKDKGEDK